MTTIRLRLLSQRKNVSSDYSVLKARPSKKYWTKYDQLWYTEPVRSVGVDDGEVPPVPIPNTEVKLTCAEDSSLETARENR